MPGVRSTDVPDRPFQLRFSTSNASRSHGSTLVGSSLGEHFKLQVALGGKPSRGSIHRLTMILRQSLLIGVPVLIDFEAADAALFVAHGGDAGPMARPEQRLPARGLGRGVVEPQQMPGQLGGGRREQVHRGVVLGGRGIAQQIAARRPGVAGQAARRNQPPQPDARPAAARRSIATGRRRPGHGNRPAARNVRPIGPTIPPAPAARATSLRCQRSSQAVAAARRSATDVRWIVCRLFTGMVPWSEGASWKDGIFLRPCVRE